MACEVWPYMINIKEGKVEITNGNVILPFEKRGKKVVPLNDKRRQFPGSRALSEDLWLPPALYSQACRMAPAILQRKR